MWKVAVRPGKPIAYGHVSGTPFLGAPGNPVSIFITFTMFSRPFILRMQGVEGDLTPLSYKVNAGFDKAGTDPRCEYARARIVRDEQGQSVAKLYTNNSSGVLNSMAWADGFVVLPVMTEISPGDSIEFIPFSELMR
jgi:molybdopterin molybdotransferase